MKTAHPAPRGGGWHLSVARPLNAYKVADQIRKAYPDENAALEDIMTVMLAGQRRYPGHSIQPAKYGDQPFCRRDPDN
jgi:hypothetical protein